MSACYFRKLERAGNEYMLAELSFANALGKIFADKTLLDLGRTFAVLPSEGHRDPYAFKESIFTVNPAPRVPVKGGVVQQVPSTRHWVVNWVAETFRSNPSLALLSESFLWRRSDVEYWVKENAPHSGDDLVHGEFVYRFATPEDPSDRIDACLDYVYPVPSGCAALWRLRADLRATIRTGNVLNDETLNWIKEGLVAILLGAYDGESVLVWTPNDAIVTAQNIEPLDT